MSFEDYAKFLGHLPICRGLNETEVIDICRTFKASNRQDGELLCAEGDAPTGMFVVETGRLRVSKRTEQGDEQELAVLNTPTVVGEMALLDGAPRSAAVRALGHCVVYEVPIDEFNALRAQGSAAAFKVVRNLALTLCERLRDTNQKIDGFFAAPDKAMAQMRERQRALFEAREKARQK